MTLHPILYMKPLSVKKYILRGLAILNIFWSKVRFWLQVHVCWLHKYTQCKKFRVRYGKSTSSSSSIMFWFCNPTCLIPLPTCLHYALTELIIISLNEFTFTLRSFTWSSTVLWYGKWYRSSKLWCPLGWKYILRSCGRIAGRQMMEEGYCSHITG